MVRSSQFGLSSLVVLLLACHCSGRISSTWSFDTMDNPSLGAVVELTSAPLALYPMSFDSPEQQFPLSAVPGREGNAIFMNSATFLKLSTTTNSTSADNLISVPSDHLLLISMWIRPTVLGEVSSTLLSKGSADGKTGWFVELNPQGSIRFAVYFMVDGTRLVYSFTTQERCQVDKWTHMGLRIDTNTSNAKPLVSVFVDGAAAESVVTHDTIQGELSNALVEPGTLLVGARATSGTASGGCMRKPFTGLLDELVIYAEEISNIAPEIPTEITPALMDIVGGIALRRTSAYGPCAPNPCKHGLCTLEGGAEKCICRFPWIGERCDEWSPVNFERAPFSPERYSETVPASSTAGDTCHAFRLREQERLSRLEWELHGSHLASQQFSATFKDSEQVFTFLEAANNTEGTASCETGSHEERDVYETPWQYEGEESFDHGTEFDIGTCPDVRDDTFQRISKVHPDFAVQMDEHSSGFIATIEAELKSYISRTDQNGSVILFGFEFDASELFTEALPPNATLIEAWAHFNMDHLASALELVNDIRFPKKANKESEPSTYIPSFSPAICIGNECVYDGIVVDSGLVPDLQTPSTPRFSPMPTRAPTRSPSRTVTRTSSQSPSPTVTPSASPQVKGPATASESECFDYRNAANAYKAQRLYQNVPVSQFFIKEFCHGTLGLTITRLSTPLTAVIQEQFIDETGRFTEPYIVDNYDVPHTYWGQTLPNECRRLIVRPVTEYQTGSMDVTVDMRACGRELGSGCEDSVTQETHVLAYHPVHLNIDNLHMMDEASWSGHNVIRTALTRKSYELRYQSTLPMFSFDRSGRTVAASYLPSLGPQVNRGYDLRVKSVAILGPISSEAYYMRIRSQICDHDNGFIYVCPYPVPVLYMAAVPKVNILIDDIVDDYDNDGLGARLEAQLCICDPGSFESKRICPPGYKYSEIEGCTYTSIGGAASLPDKPEGVNRWYSYCDAMLNRFASGSGRRVTGHTVSDLPDVSLFVDTDGDGLNDGEEVIGVYLPEHLHIQRTSREMIPHSIMLNLMGAIPTQKDVFMEIDTTFEDVSAQYASHPFSTIGTVRTDPSGVVSTFWRALYFNTSREWYGELKARSVLNPNGRDGIRVHFDAGYDPARYEWSVRQFVDILPGYRNFTVSSAKCTTYLQVLGISTPTSRQIDECRAAVQIEMEMYDEGTFGWWGGAYVVSEVSAHNWCYFGGFPKRHPHGSYDSYSECVSQLNAEEPNYRGYVTEFRDYRKRYFYYGVAHTPGGGLALHQWSQFSLEAPEPLPHELGHMLGLGHGGPLEPKRSDVKYVNCHPFFFSPMNYKFGYDRSIRFFEEDNPERFDIQPASIAEWNFMDIELTLTQRLMWQRSHNLPNLAQNFTDPGFLSVDWNHDRFISMLHETGTPLPATTSHHIFTPQLHAIPSESTEQLLVQGTPTYCGPGGETLTGRHERTFAVGLITEPVLGRLGESLYSFYIRASNRDTVTISSAPLGPPQSLDCSSQMGIQYAPYQGNACMAWGPSTNSPTFPSHLKYVAVTRYAGEFILLGVTRGCKVYQSRSTSNGDGESLGWSEPALMQAAETCSKPAIVNSPRYDGATRIECLRMYWIEPVTMQIKEFMECVDGFTNIKPLIDDTTGNLLTGDTSIAAVTWPAPGDEMSEHEVYETNGHLATPVLTVSNGTSFYMAHLWHPNQRWVSRTHNQFKCEGVGPGLAFTFLRRADGGYLDDNHPGKFWVFWGDSNCGTETQRASSIFSRPMDAQTGLSATGIEFNQFQRARLGYFKYFQRANTSINLFADSRTQTMKGFMTTANSRTKFMPLANGVSKDTFAVENEGQLIAAGLCRVLKARYVLGEDYRYKTVHCSCPGSDHGRRWSPFGN